MKRLLRKLRGPSEKEVEETLEGLIKKGLVEICGYDHGEPMYRLTEKGLKEQEQKQDNKGRSKKGKKMKCANCGQEKKLRPNGLCEDCVKIMAARYR